MLHATDNDRALVMVSDVLEMASVQHGFPEIIASADHLDRNVRWVHVAAGTGVASVLTGGELLLTTGAGWPNDLPSLLAELNDLLQANVAAIFLELGTRFTTVPDQVVALCEQRRVPLVVLHNETPFVRVTEQVHRAILAEQTAALAARDEVQAMLTQLGLQEAPVDYVIEQLAAELESPVILENMQGEVISWAKAGSERDNPEILSNWPRTSEEELPEGAINVWVEARGSRWGQLVALPGAPHLAGRRSVLELGAVALALGRLADPYDRAERWLGIDAKKLIESLISREFRDENEVTAQLRARGLDLEKSLVVAFEIRVDAAVHTLDTHSLSVILDALAQVATARDARVLTHFPVPQNNRIFGLLTLPVNSDSATENVAEALVLQLKSSNASALLPQLEVVFGRPTQRPLELIESIETLQNQAKLHFEVVADSLRVAFAERQPLALLVAQLKTDPRIERFTRDVLAPLFEYDREHKADLVEVLSAYVRFPANRSRGAEAAQLSRSVFYQRISLIEEVLGVDLSDGETLAALFLALQYAALQANKLE